MYHSLIAMETTAQHDQSSKYKRQLTRLHHEESTENTYVGIAILVIILGAGVVLIVLGINKKNTDFLIIGSIFVIGGFFFFVLLVFTNLKWYMRHRGMDIDRGKLCKSCVCWNDQ
ncbi:hypothetical protein ACF0H5_010796 [Mactra antiquata]